MKKGDCTEGCGKDFDTEFRYSWWDEKLRCKECDSKLKKERERSENKK